MVLVSRDYASEGLVAFLCSPGSLLMSANASFRIAVSPNNLMGLLAVISLPGVIELANHGPNCA